MTAGEVERLIVEALSFHEIQWTGFGRHRSQRLVGRLETTQTLDEAAVRKLYAVIGLRRTLPRWVAMLKQLLAHLSSIKVAYDHRLTMSENLASPVVDYVTRRAAKWNSPNTETVLSDKAWASLANALRLRLSSSGRQAIDWMWQGAGMNRALLRR